MRTSRVSRDAARVFDLATEPVSPPRRTTRSTLARFAYATETKSELRDIEDAASPPARKRRRVTTAKTETIASPNGIKCEVVEEPLSNIASPPKPPRRTRKPARKTVDPSTGATAIAPPSDWEDMYNAVKTMRAPGGRAHGAAVDTMGCERLADRSASEKDQRFHTLVSLMLSSQTKDTVNAVVMKKLQTQLPAYKPGAPVGLNLDNMLAVEPKLLNELIWAVGFHNNKTKYLKQAAVILRETWNDDIPDTIEGLTSLPGVGPKMAYLCMSVAWNRTEGIGVDVHVHRITNLWGWNKTKNPEETRLALQSWLPHDKWREINYLLVGFGQTVCLPVGRKCGHCDLGLNGLCKAAERKKVIEGRRIKEEKIEAENKTLFKTEQLKEEVVIKEEIVDRSIEHVKDVRSAPPSAPPP
ncbi:Fc.00g102770.m01.CDS01 [Cosmosporella sp. VM-42]